MELKSHDEIINLKTNRVPIIKGVYFLINDTENIIYIGKSVDCYRRVKTHQNQNRKHFTFYTIIECKDHEDLDELEIHYIKKFNPYYNKAHNTEALQLKFATKKEDIMDTYKANTYGRPKGLSDRIKTISKHVISRYLDEKYTVASIIKEFGISKGSFYKILRENNVDLSSNHKNKGNTNAGRKNVLKAV